MSDTKWRTWFIGMAKFYSRLSKDPDVKVGSVIVDAERRIIGGGYNGFPRGVRDDAGRYEDKFVKNHLIVHAETNAILNASVKVRDSTLYCTRFPCTSCTKLIIQTGIWKIVVPRMDPESSWAVDAKFSEQMLLETHVIIDYFTKEELDNV